MVENKILVGVVGPCGSGKSTLVFTLQKNGYTCHHIAQEHSYVQDMWKRITNPDVLVFLQASFKVCTTRRKLNWSEAEYDEQQRRLSHARIHANIIIDTDQLSPQDVAQQALKYLVQI